MAANERSETPGAVANVGPLSKPYKIGSRRNDGIANFVDKAMVKGPSSITNALLSEKSAGTPSGEIGGSIRIAGSCWTNGSISA